MCGIVGYIGGGKAAGIIYQGLERLEYRGYDSAGLAVAEGGKISVVKKAGRVALLKNSCVSLNGGIGIGHTRWATHGRPSDINAHPHQYGKIVIAHNGIIENYSAIKARLISLGDKFNSETDSEVIAHLINRFYKGDLLTAVRQCAKMLKGSYALLAICEDEQKIVAAKYRSPVILGFGEGFNMCASDFPALAGNCPEVCVLEDGDFASITQNGVSICDIYGNPLERKRIKNNAEAANLCLRGYPHFMLKELWEAPAAVRNTISAVYAAKECILKSFAGAEKIILTGCGTAYHAALAGVRYIEDFTNIPVSAEYAGELRYKKIKPQKGLLLVAVTQSGETADTLEAARAYKAAGAEVLAVTNSPHSAITRVAGAIVPVEAGAEISVAATKSYSGQLAALYSLACIISGRAAPRADISRLILKTLEDMDIYALAEMCARSRGVYFVGRDIDYSVALEGSLKLKEVSYIAGGGYPASELKHGAIALIDDKTVTAFIICDKFLAAKSAAAAEQVLARRGKVAVITTLKDTAAQFKGRAEVILLPACDKYLSPLLAASVVHMLAYRTAVVLGCDPDKPRNLAKSVTVE